MEVQISLTAQLSLPQPTPSLLQVEAAATPDGSQTVRSSSLTITPHTEAAPFTDAYGNPCRRLMLAGGDVTIQYQATVDAPPVHVSGLSLGEQPDALHLPPETLLYTFPSRYCESDKLAALAGDLFGDTPPGLERVQAICTWINQKVTYQYGVSNASTSALDTLCLRTGICRDFAHLGIAFCRALNLPARFASGYCLGLEPPDFHAWFHVWLDGRWVAFDATTMRTRRALVQVAVGRDAADCAWSTFYGTGQTRSLDVRVEEARP